MDTVAEFLVNIKNARLAGREKVDIPSSKVRRAMAEILKQKGWIKDYRIADDGKQGLMRVYLSNSQKFKGEFRRVSKPSRRVYSGYQGIGPVRSGRGFAILSTNLGIITDEEARQKKVGGELMCILW